MSAMPHPSFDPMKPWWLDVPEVHLLLRWLVDTGHILTLTEAVDLLEKPHKYDGERHEMLRHEALERLDEESACFEDDMRRRGAL